MCASGLVVGVLLALLPAPTQGLVPRFPQKEVAMHASPAAGEPVLPLWGVGLAPAICGVAVAAAAVWALHRRAAAAGNVAMEAGGAGEIKRRYMPYTFIHDKDFAGKFTVVDTTHPDAPMLTHHKGGFEQSGLLGDSSGEIVLNALRARERHPALDMPYVTCDHFDVDGIVSVWAALHPAEALELGPLLTEVSRIGDFRELDLSREHADTALKVCCWLNTVERQVFYRPFDGDESTGSVQKYEFFLPRFEAVLRDPEAFKKDWSDEYRQVTRGVSDLRADGAVRPHDLLGLVVIHAPRPVHYYALFGLTMGYDVVLSMYPGNRYEVECKYSAFVDLSSRPVPPRISMAPLARVLNKLEAVSTAATWEANRFVEAGPILRLNRPGERLTKAQRYGNPCDRPVHASSIPPAMMERVVVGWLQHGMLGHEPKKYWSWEELHTLNKAIDWGPWMESQGLPPQKERVAEEPQAPRRRKAPKAVKQINLV